MNPISKYCLLALFFFFLSCENRSDSRQQRIQSYLHKRLQSHKEFEREKCIKNIRNKAKKRVDNYILENEEKILSRRRTTNLPPKPQRPPLKRGTDSLRVLPILKDSM